VFFSILFIQSSTSVHPQQTIHVQAVNASFNPLPVYEKNGLLVNLSVIYSSSHYIVLIVEARVLTFSTVYIVTGQ